MNVITGAPAIDAREQNEINVYRRLTEWGIPFRQLDHPAAATMDACREIDQALGVRMCKNLFLCNRQQTNFYLFMVPGELRFSSKTFARLMSIARVSFAPESFMEELLSLRPGAVSVMGLANDTGKRVQLVIDRRLLKCEYVACHPCVNTATVCLKTADLLEKFLPRTGHEPVVIDWEEEE